MRLEKNIYPYNPEVKQFPFFLSSIGGSRFQPSINRPNGYQWHQILFCADGEGILEFFDKKIQLSRGDYFFLPKLQSHSYYPLTEQWDVRWTAFEGSSCDNVLERLNMTIPIVIHPDAEATMEKIFDRMIRSIETDILYCDYICSGLIYDYILEFHRYMDKERAGEKSRNITMLLPALRLMHENYKSDISMTELSDMIGITPQHFCRVFRKTMGMRPNVFLTKIRLEEAKRLLSELDSTVAYAAEQSGFRDTCYFSTVFKKYIGMTPSDYKKSNS